MRGARIRCVSPLDRNSDPNAPHQLSLRAFLLFVTVFWVYVSFTRITQWELMRQGTGSVSRSGVGTPEFILEDILLFPILILLCLVSRRVGYDLRRWHIRAAAHFGLAVAFGVCGRPMLIVARSILQDMTIAASLARTDGVNPLGALKLYVSATLDIGLQYVFLQGLLAGFTYVARFRHEQWLRARLESQYERARLHALRMQINPHFLYNTLSAIAGLVRINPGAAENMVTRLGELFRRALTERNSEFVPLREEIGHVDQYLQIQRARFEDRLAYELRVAPAAEAAAIPPLLLQPLLENAVEHGLGMTHGRVNIEVECVVQGNEVALIVRNTGTQPVLQPQRPSHGFGLASVRERLDAAFGEAASFDFANPAPGQFEARLRFPLVLLADRMENAA